MLFYCNSCRYIFEEAEGCQQCPDCGKMTVRIANEEERSEYKRNQEEKQKTGPNGTRSFLSDCKRLFFLDFFKAIP